MRVNRSAFEQFMTYKGLSIRGLADITVVQYKGRKPKKIGHATIGHLLSGERTTCSSETARAIEKALQVPPGTIFVPEMLNVSPHVPQTGRAA